MYIEELHDLCFWAEIGHLGVWEMGTWVYGRLGTWVYGRWALGCMGDGHLGVWEMDTWVYGRWALGCMGDGHAYRVLVGSSKGRDNLKYVGIDGRIYCILFTVYFNVHIHYN